MNGVFPIMRLGVNGVPPPLDVGKSVKKKGYDLSSVLKGLTNSVPPGFYNVVCDPITKIYTIVYSYKKADVGVMFGDIHTRLDKIVDYHKSSPIGGSAILHGLKGMGKTKLMNLVGNVMVDAGIPVLIVESNFTDENFKALLDGVGEAVIIFDEFDRNYGPRDQDKLLGFMDGLSSVNRLYLVSTNTVGDLIGPFKSRPARFRFSMEFKGLTLDDSKPALDESSMTKECRSFLEFIIKNNSEVNWDLLNALIEEGELSKTVKEFADRLVDLNTDVDGLVQIELDEMDGVEFKPGRIVHVTDSPNLNNIKIQLIIQSNVRDFTKPTGKDGVVITKLVVNKTNRRIEVGKSPTKQVQVNKDNSTISIGIDISKISLYKVYISGKKINMVEGTKYEWT